MNKVVFPGSFDPPTNGHLDIIEKAAKLFDEVFVVFAENPEKKYLFTIEERLDFMKNLVSHLDNVKVDCWNGLIVDYAEKIGAGVLIRGIRNSVDFTYEFEMSMLNKKLNGNIETIFIPTEQKFMLMKSSTVKEMVKYGGDVSDMVPLYIEKRLKEKLR